MIKRARKPITCFSRTRLTIRAYVGGPKDAVAYQQLRADKKLAREDLQDAEMYQDATMEWSLWGRWRRSVGTYGRGRHHLKTKPTVRLR